MSMKREEWQWLNKISKTKFQRQNGYNRYTIQLQINPAAPKPIAKKTNITIQNQIVFKTSYQLDHQVMF